MMIKSEESASLFEQRLKSSEGYMTDSAVFILADKVHFVLNSMGNNTA